MGSYIKGISHVRINLSGNKDHLLWSWNTNSGEVTSKGAYSAIISSMGRPIVIWLYNCVWKWYIPTKLKCFVWLLLENNILT